MVQGQAKVRMGRPFGAIGRRSGCMGGSGLGSGTSAVLLLNCSPLSIVCREKVNNAVLFEKQVYEKLLVEVPKYKMITPSILSDRMRIGGSLARAAIHELAAKGLIRPLVKHSKQLIYTRATGA